LLHTFEKQTATLPRSTEAERVVVQRVGQGIFRAGLLEYWEGRCAITGLAVPALLKASHIKPWADCASDAERLDVFNGLLLAPHLDAAFDCGLITVADDGAVVVSETGWERERDSFWGSPLRSLSKRSPLAIECICRGIGSMSSGRG
jgi:putative restriction endonuclease